MAISFRHQIPDTVQPSVSLCHQRLEYLQSIFHKSSKMKLLASSYEIEKALKGFSSSVKLLRDVMMEYDRLTFSIDRVY